jgi:hypothetical protein
MLLIQFFIFIFMQSPLEQAAHKKRNKETPVNQFGMHYDNLENSIRSGVTRLYWIYYPFRFGTSKVMISGDYMLFGLVYFL